MFAKTRRGKQRLPSYAQRLITQNQQDSDPSKYILSLMTKEPHDTIFVFKWIGVFVSTATLVFSSFVFIDLASGAPLNSNQGYSGNVQNMQLLQPRIGVEILEPMGGADDMLAEEDALIPNISTITDTDYKIENTCNPRNDSIEIYKVREGDTISDIAKMFCVSVDTIRWANNVNKNIRIGQELTILPISGVMHDVEKGDTIAKIAKKYGGSTEAVMAYNNISEDTILTTEMSIIVPNGKKTSVSTSSGTKVVSSGSSLAQTATPGYFIKPASGKITSGFGYRTDPITGAKRFHSGVDIANDIGATVMAAASGRVIEVRASGWNGGYGKKIVILHGDGSKTLYAHLNSIDVSVGDIVDQGEKIGTIGRTGRVTGSHLHLEVISKTGKNLKPVF